MKDLDLRYVVRKAKEQKKMKMRKENPIPNTTKMIIKVNPATEVLLSPMSCDIYGRGLTAYVCRLPDGNRRVNEYGEKVCGLATNASERRD